MSVALWLLVWCAISLPVSLVLGALLGRNIELGVPRVVAPEVPLLPDVLRAG